MKKSRKLAFVLTLALVFSCFGSITSFAFDNGFRGATEYTGKVTDYLSSATETEWYQFTLTADDVATPYSVSLKSSGSCRYSFDLWYRSGSSGRPSVVSNEVTVTRSGDTRTMSGVLTEPGTYFVRVYFLSGTVSTLNTYRLIIKHDRDETRGFIYDYGTSFPPATYADWAVCADILGNYTFGTTIKDFATNRNYKNAGAFIISNYTSDSEGSYENTVKATPEQVATAANYVYSGGLMTKPKFKLETNKKYTVEEIMYYVYELDEPMIFYAQNEIVDMPELKRYIVLDSINIGQDTMRYIDPYTGMYSTISYSGFITNGIQAGSSYYVYSGTNIVNTNMPRPVQPAYN